MIKDYQFYHGALLHEIVSTSGVPVRISLHDFHGRPDAFVINEEVGLLIKHSSSRLTPWTFTFSRDHIGELHSLRAITKVCFVGFVCDEDGFVCVRDVDLIGILTPTESNVASVRIDRPPRKMYRVSSSGNRLDEKLARGVDELVAEIKRQSVGYVLPSSGP